MSLSEQLAKVKLVSHGPVKDTAGPKLSGFIDEAQIKQYQNEVLDVNIEEWIGPLSSVTFPTYFIPIDPDDAKALIFKYEQQEDHLKKLQREQEDAADPQSSKRPSDFAMESLSLSESQVNERLDQLAQKIQNQIEQVRSQSPLGVFVKMSSRSAKDAPVVGQKLRSLYRQYLTEMVPAGQRRSDVNGQAAALLRAGTESLRVSSGAEALNLFIHSERIWQDMKLALDNSERWNENVVVREWVPIDVDMEFRGFYHNGRLRALSQYNHMVLFPRLLEMKDVLQQRILQFFEREVYPAMQTAGLEKRNFVIDFAVTGENLDRLYVIELNPFLSSTDGALFSWRQDEEVLKNGPFEFRLRDKKMRRIEGHAVYRLARSYEH